MYYLTEELLRKIKQNGRIAGHAQAHVASNLTELPACCYARNLVGYIDSIAQKYEHSYYKSGFMLVCRFEFDAPRTLEAHVVEKAKELLIWDLAKHSKYEITISIYPMGYMDEARAMKEGYKYHITIRAFL